MAEDSGQPTPAVLLNDLQAQRMKDQRQIRANEETVFTTTTPNTLREAALEAALGSVTSSGGGYITEKHAPYAAVARPLPEQLEMVIDTALYLAGNMANLADKESLASYVEKVNTSFTLTAPSTLPKIIIVFTSSSGKKHILKELDTFHEGESMRGVLDTIDVRDLAAKAAMLSE